MSVVLVPAVVHYGERQWARSTFLRHDGTPLARAAIVAYHCEGDGCSPPASATTDAGGRYDLRLLTDNNNSCRLLLPSMATPGARFDAFWVSAARRQTYVAVRAQAVAAVRRGRSFVVSATVLPGGGQVALQRLVGRTWRTTTSTTVSFTGAARLVGSSTVLGNQYFRLRAHGPADILPTTSRYFVVLGTRR
jgi:hypothetical protein